MKIGVVIVTYNRLEKLKKCLASYEAQSLVPEFLCIVNNHSTDGTSEYLDSWASSATAPFKKIVLHSDTNLGGAGGFCKGIETALTQLCDWIWISDDDAFPEKDCLKKIYQYYTSLNEAEQANISALCAKVVDNNGISPLHRRYLRKSSLQIKEIPFSETDYSVQTNEIAFFSFVGTMIRTSTIQKIGLPHKDYFIFYDDSEYSLRVLQEGKIYCLSEAVVLHDSLENTIQPYSWKNYYMFRNKLYTYKLYFKKRYCCIEYLKTIFMIMKYYNTLKTWKQFIDASHDYKHNILGKHDKYLP